MHYLASLLTMIFFQVHTRQTKSRIISDLIGDLVNAMIMVNQSALDLMLFQNVSKAFRDLNSGHSLNTSREWCTVYNSPFHKNDVKAFSVYQKERRSKATEHGNTVCLNVIPTSLTGQVHLAARKN